MIKKKFFKDEEFWNTLTHGFGALLSIAALVALILAAVKGSLLDVISATVFGASMLLLYTASTFYHAARNPEHKSILQRFDHLCIYLLIAGTYTPILLIGLKGMWGWTIFGIVWGLAALGFVFKLSKLRKYKKASLIFYLLMGWMAIIAVKPLVEQLSTKALIWIALGGVFYTVGTWFFVREKKKYNHTIWHLFVLAGSGSHFLAIFLYILP